MTENGGMLSSILDDLLREEPAMDLGALVNEETPHLPVIILIDTSESMGKDIHGETNIRRVNQALRRFISDVEAGASEVFEKIRECGDFCVISYGNGGVQVVVPWTHGTELRSGALADLTAGSGTPMHAAIVTAGDMMLERLRGYKRDDIEAYCGAVFNLTDGEPTDNKEQARARKVIDLFESGTSAGKALAEFHHVGVPGHKLDSLIALSVSPDRVKEIGVEIADFFRYIVITFSGIAGTNASAVDQADWRQHKTDG